MSKSWAATMLMGALSLSFVVWGIGDIFQGGLSSSIAKVGGTQIDQGAFSRSYRNLIRSQSTQMGTDITPEMAEKMGLGQAALQQMISRVALNNTATGMGLTTPDSVVAQSIRNMDVFHGPTGEFNRLTFQQVLQNAGYTEDQFVEDMRHDDTLAQLTSAVESFFLLPPAYAEGLFQYISERRATHYLVLKPSAAGDIKPPSDTELAAYVKAHAARYSTPEYRQAEYAEISPADIGDTVAVTDAQVKQQYQAKKATFVVAEKRTIQQIEFKTEAEAKAARQKIDAGTSFTELAKQRGIKPADLDLGTLTESDLPDPERAKAIFALPLDQVSQPLKTAFGSWVLARVTSISPGSSKTLEEATPEIRENLKNQLVQAKMVDIINAYTDARNTGDNMAQAARKAGMKVVKLAAVDQAGMTPDGKPSAAPKDPEFLSALFKAGVGDDGDPFNTKIGNYYVIHVDGVTPPKLKPMSAVHDAALAAWTTEQRDKILTQKAKTLSAQATKDKSLDGIAETLGLEVQESPALSRQTNDAIFPASLVEDIFNAPPGGVVWGKDGLSGNFVIARVTGISHPAVNAKDPSYLQGARQLSQSVASDFTISLANAARANQGVQVNEELLKSTIGSGGY